jgi:cytochrome c-type biogenesis protein CcmH/NrfG
MSNQLDTVVFIALPVEMRDLVQSIHIPTGVLLPVETGMDPKHWDPTNLTWEMILAGMVKVTAWQPDHEHHLFYRQFLLQAQPSIVNDLIQLGIGYAEAEQFTEAEEMFRASAAIAPERPEGLVNLALTMERRGDALLQLGRDEDAELVWEATAAVYRSALATFSPPPTELLMNGGLFFIKIQNIPQGMVYLQEFSSLTTDESAQQRVDHILTQLRQQETSDRLFKEAFDFINMGAEERGVARIREFLEQNKDSWNGWFLLGWGLRRIGKFSEALDAFQQAVELGGDTADTFNELAICNMELNKLDDAYSTLDYALRRDPDNVRIISNFGVLFMKRGEQDEARRFFETALALDPEDVVAQQFIQSME